MNQDEIPAVTAEVKAAWDVIANHLNKHPKLSFFINPWSGSTLKAEKRYTLQYMDGSKEITIVEASEPYTREKR